MGGIGSEAVPEKMARARKEHEGVGRFVWCARPSGYDHENDSNSVFPAGVISIVWIGVSVH